MRLGERTAPPEPPAAETFTFDETANRYGVRITGPGDGRSATFDLVGAYGLKWQTGDPTCAMEAHLEFTTGGRAFKEFAPPSRSGTGTVTARPDSYVLVVTSACSWSFTFSPR